MNETPRNVQLVRDAAETTLEMVVNWPNDTTHGNDPPNGPGRVEEDVFGGSLPTPYEYAVAKAVQSVAQTTAIAVQDAADLMRNVGTAETVAIGAATAKWIAQPSQVGYREIINKSLETIKATAAAFKDIGDAAVYVLNQLDVHGQKPTRAVEVPEETSQ
jgi:hypothetical protein